MTNLYIRKKRILFNYLKFQNAGCLQILRREFFSNSKCNFAIDHPLAKFALAKRLCSEHSSEVTLFLILILSVKVTFFPGTALRQVS